MSHDPITKPSHYNWHPSGVECKDITDDLPRWLGDAITYIWRRNHKGQGLDDCHKALERLGEATPARLDTLRESYIPGTAYDAALLIRPAPDALIWKAAVLVAEACQGSPAETLRALIDDIRGHLQREISEMTHEKASQDHQ